MTFIGFPSLKRKHKCGKKEQYNASATVCQDAAFSAFDKVHGSKSLLNDFEQVLTWLSVSSYKYSDYSVYLALLSLHSDQEITTGANLSAI